MKIKILVSCVGDNFDFVAGQTVDVVPELGADLVRGRIAEQVEDEPKGRGKLKAE